MTRLPNHGELPYDTVLNDFLSVAHNADGTLKGSANVVLSSSPSAGATTFDLATVPPGLVTGSIIAIDPYTTEVELRRVTNVSSNTVTVSALTYAHAAGDAVFVHQGGLIPWTWAGAKGSGSQTDATTNVTAFNRLTNQIHNVSGGDFSPGGIFVPGGAWYVDSELRPERGQTIQGAGVMNSKIAAADTFSFPDTETAIIHPYRDGLPVIYATPGPSSRWGMRDIFIDGRNVTGANGIVSSPQQPDYWENVRVDNCPGYGIAIVDCQQHVMNNIELIGNGTALTYRSAQFVWVTGLNIENSVTRDFVAVSQAGGLDCWNNHFLGVHIESPPFGAGVKSFEITSGGGWEFHNVWVSNPDQVGVSFYFNVNVLTNYPIFLLENVHINQPSTSWLAINDVQRGLTRTVTAVNRLIQLIVSGLDTAAVPGWALEITGKAGGGAADPPRFVNGIRLGGNVYGGAGAPAPAGAADGDFYFRTDTPGTANQRLYVRSGGAWTGIL